MALIKKLFSGAKNLAAGALNGLIGTNLGSPSSPFTKIGSMATNLVGSAIPGGGMVKALIGGGPSFAPVKQSTAIKGQNAAFDSKFVNAMATPTTPKASAGAAAFGATGSGTVGTTEQPSGSWWENNKKWAQPVAIALGSIIALFVIVKTFFSKRKRK